MGNIGVRHCMMHGVILPSMLSSNCLVCFHNIFVLYFVKYVIRDGRTRELYLTGWWLPFIRHLWVNPDIQVGCIPRIKLVIVVSLHYIISLLPRGLQVRTTVMTAGENDYLLVLDFTVFNIMHSTIYFWRYHKIMII